MITKEELLQTQYEEVPFIYKNSDRYYQKVVLSSENAYYTKYIIKVGMWDYRKFDTTATISFEFSGNFYLPDKRNFVVIYVPEDDATLVLIETFFEDIFCNMKCIPDIHHNPFADYYTKRKAKN
jgi:hypothetical protein